MSWPLIGCWALVPAIKAARQTLGLTQTGLAVALRLANAETNGRRTVRNWETGANPISGPASVAIEMMLAAKAAQKGD